MGAVKRRHFRIKYPMGDRPLLHFNGQQFKVLDLSESGLKFMAGQARFNLRDPVDGVIKFPTGEYKVQGHVVRTVGDLAMVAFGRNIPINVLKAEADRLIARYGKVETPSEYK